MPKYNILIDTDTDPDLEAGVQKVTADYNATLPPGDPTAEPPVPAGVPLTAEEYLTRVLTIAVASYKVEAIEERTEVLSRKFEKADPAKRAEVEAALAAIPDSEVGAGGGAKAESSEEDLFSLNRNRNTSKP